MNNKYFSYSFQLSNTKKIIIAFFVVAVAAVICYFVFLNKKTKQEHIKNLYYQKMLGMEKFESNSCDTGYKIYYEKKTCGSICLNVLDSDSSYLSTLKDNMIDNGFKIDEIKGTEINGNTWDYFETKEEGPKFKYYASIFDNKLYSVEIIKQTMLLSKKEISKCNSNFKKFENSLKLK